MGITVSCELSETSQELSFSKLIDSTYYDSHQVATSVDSSSSQRKPLNPWTQSTDLHPRKTGASHLLSSRTLTCNLCSSLKKFNLLSTLLNRPVQSRGPPRKIL